MAEFECPFHGRFELTVPRDTNGDPPEAAKCRAVCGEGVSEEDTLCLEMSPWCISAPMGRVRTAEVQRGRVDKPDSPMYLDTRELGEGMPYDDWRAKRDKLYEERRHKEAKDFFK